MVTADDRLQGAEASPFGQWGRMRLLLALLVLLFSFSVLLFAFHQDGDQSAGPPAGSLSQWLRDQGMVSVLERFGDGAGGEMGAGLDSKPWHQHRVCERMLQIVESACTFASADRDSEVYWACVARELKYTMWSAYGCD